MARISPFTLSARRYDMYLKRSARTSRGALHKKMTYFLCLESQGKVYWGEAGVFPNLSPEAGPDFEQKLNDLITEANTNQQLPKASEYQHLPSVAFALEQIDLGFSHARHAGKHRFCTYDTSFNQLKRGIPINGLIWMGDATFMQEQIDNKLAQGFSCLKMKIGAIDWAKEIELLKGIRSRYSAEALTLRVDANGAFEPGDALSKLEELSRLDIHSIEQPIRQGQWESMARLCKQSPIPIALDEELIGITKLKDKKDLLHTIQPHYLIFKPTLLGGIEACEEWIGLAKPLSIDYWPTSALESNLGLHAIAQWAGHLNLSIPQGLGTGGMYVDNITTPLEINGEELWLRDALYWNSQQFDTIYASPSL
ncbi:MAG TPA: o-succinylbenzoate synthase [Bacteroidetes bacterium]|nr:o-succinylbenzoate synthase [Bacteroidota bacterium]